MWSKCWFHFLILIARPHLAQPVRFPLQLEPPRLQSNYNLIWCDLFRLPHRHSPDARATLYMLETTPLFYQHMDDAITPHLTLVHRYPDLFPRVRIDRGAIRFVLSGATLMVPGLTSPGGRLPSGNTTALAASDGASSEGSGEPANGGVMGVPSGEGLTSADDERYLTQPDLPAGTVVVVEAEGKEQACCVGVLKMGTKEMKDVKKGVGMEGAHYLGDGLWKILD